MIHNHTIEKNNIFLRQLEYKDIEQLRVWRNDKENSKYIRKIEEISPKQQIAWFERYLSDVNEMIFAIEYMGKLAGSVSLYDFKEKEATFGKLMVGKPKNCGIGSSATVACLQVGFNGLGLEKIRAEVSIDNTGALIIYTRIGFCITARQYNEAARLDEFVIEITKDRFQTINDSPESMRGKATLR